jgi:hypothetical protein
VRNLIASLYDLAPIYPPATTENEIGVASFTCDPDLIFKCIEALPPANRKAGIAQDEEFPFCIALIFQAIEQIFGIAQVGHSS